MRVFLLKKLYIPLRREKISDLSVLLTVIARK
jgi:hypothetical protein